MKIIGKIVVGTLVILGAFGCSHQNAEKQTPLEANWGRSFETARYNQIANPGAGMQKEETTSMEGPVAERIVEGYMTGEESKQESPAEFGILKIK